MNFSNFYEGSVPMIPEITKCDFISEYEYSVEIPKVFFECTGEKYELQSAFEWDDSSITVVKGNYVTRYVESNFNEVLVPDVDGNNCWLEGRLADFYGYTDADVKEHIEKKHYAIEEYDLEKQLMRKYKVVLEEEKSIEELDSFVRKCAHKEIEGTRYIMTDFN